MVVYSHRLQKNQVVLLQKLEDAGNDFRQFNVELNNLSMAFRKLDRDVNTSRPEIMQLIEEKQRYTE